MAERDDEYTEWLVRLVVRANDPMRGRTPPPSPVTADELRLAAEARRSRPNHRPSAIRHAARRGKLRPGRWLRWATPLGAAVVALIVLATGKTPLTRPAPDGHPAIETFTAPAPLSLQLTDQPEPARDRLQHLADTIAATPDPAPSGRYGHIHTQRWPADTGTPPPGQLLAADDELWTTPQRTAHVRTTVLPPQPAGRVLAAWITSPPAGQPHRTDYQPGELAALALVPSTEPAILAGQLAGSVSGPRSPDVTLGAVATMNRYHVLGARQRAAILQVLADTDGLDLRGQVTDRAGRSGIAVSVDNTADATRDLAVFDADSGALLSYERIAMVTNARSPVRAATVLSYVLYLAAEWTNQIG